MGYPYYNPSYPVYGQTQNIPLMSQNTPMINTPQPQTNQSLTWVQGESGAKSYMIPPSSTVLLMDSEQNRFYLKSADAAGMPTLKTYEYKEITQNIPQPQVLPENNYVTREEYTNLEDKYNELLTRIEELSKERKTVTKRKEVIENE